MRLTSLKVQCVAAAGYRSVVQPVSRAPYVRGGTSLAAYRRLLSHNLRHDVERRLRRREAGAVSVELSDGNVASVSRSGGSRARRQAS
jgi:hypothetical protein